MEAYCGPSLLLTASLHLQVSKVLCKTFLVSKVPCMGELVPGKANTTELALHTITSEVFENFRTVGRTSSDSFGPVAVDGSK